jgi:phage/plasmid-like protein (TIGR03299 family)
MAHAIENMFSVRQTPWHGLGEVLADHPTIETAIEKAGLNWSADVEPCYDAHGNDISSFANIVRRSSDKSILGVVGPKYRPLQNIESFNWFRPFLESGECNLTTAGSLHNGRVVWVMAEINRGTSVITQGDVIRKFFLLSNSHDGTQAVRVGFTPIRVVCANTLGMAHRDTESKLLRVRHTSKVVYTLSMIRDIVDMVDEQFNATAEQFRALSRMKINRSDLRKYVKLVFGFGDDTTARQNTLIDDCISRALTGKGQTPDNLTAWSAYNGVTEYLSYATAHRTKDARLDSLWFGDNKKTIDAALTLALAM